MSLSSRSKRSSCRRWPATRAWMSLGNPSRCALKRRVARALLKARNHPKLRFLLPQILHTRIYKHESNNCGPYPTRIKHVTGKEQGLALHNRRNSLNLSRQVSFLTSRRLLGFKVAELGEGSRPRIAWINEKELVYRTYGLALLEK